MPAKSSKRLTQDSLAVKYDASHTPLLPGWVGSDGQPPNKGRRMVDVDISNRAGAVGGFHQMGVSPSRRSGTSADPKRYHRHFDDGDEFGDGLVPQEHARHYREGGGRGGGRAGCVASMAYERPTPSPRRVTNSIRAGWRRVAAPPLRGDGARTGPSLV